MEELNHQDSRLCAELFEDYHHPFGAFTTAVRNGQDYSYVNAASCPDCGGGMVKLGNCFSCPSCGFGSCGN